MWQSCRSIAAEIWRFDIWPRKLPLRSKSAKLKNRKRSIDAKTKPKKVVTVLIKHSVCPVGLLENKNKKHNTWSNAVLCVASYKKDGHPPLIHFNKYRIALPLNDLLRFPYKRKNLRQFRSACEQWSCSSETFFVLRSLCIRCVLQSVTIFHNG